MTESNAALDAALAQLREKTNRELKQMFYGDTMPLSWTTQYDPYRFGEPLYNPFSNRHNSYHTPKETTPVTSSTLNDMTVAELEALAERTANTLREKKEKEEQANVVKFTHGFMDYTYDRTTKRLRKKGGTMDSVFQSVIDEFHRVSVYKSKSDYQYIAAIFTAITPTN